MKILFRKILDYNLKKDKINSYTYACKILSQKINPGSLQREKFISKTNVIVCSKLKRATQCIKKSKNLKIIFTESLNEIPFDLKLYSSKVDFKKEGSLTVRKTFKKLFVQDGLIIKRDKIFKQIEKLIRDIRKNCSSEKNITILSHSFRLKCIEAYLDTNGGIIKNPKFIEKYVKDKEKTFDFGEGFDFEI